MSQSISAWKQEAQVMRNVNPNLNQTITLTGHKTVQL